MNRKNAPSIDPDDCDFDFQILDVTISYSERNHKLNRKESFTYIHGNTENGNTVIVQCVGYKPYFYLSLPESALYDEKRNYISEIENKLQSIETTSYNKELPKKELASIRYVYKKPLVGFRNNEPMKVIRFRFHTLNAYWSYRRALLTLFPPPTKNEIENGIYRNEFVICESKEIPEEYKFLNEKFLICGGWIRLPKGRYELLDSDLFPSTSQYCWTIDESVIEPLNDKKTIAPVLIDSFDIETRSENPNSMPNPHNINDFIVSIAHVLQWSNEPEKMDYIVWTWYPSNKNSNSNNVFNVETNSHVSFPTVNKLKQPLEKRNIIVKEYKSEKDMLIQWIDWWKKLSSDVIIGWNIYGFDLQWLYTRMETLQLESSSFCWGRLSNIKTVKQSISIGRKINNMNYIITPSFGRIFIDDLFLYKADLTIRLKSYSLNFVAETFLKEGKANVHYSEIDSLFHGSNENRGRLLWYNVHDSYLVLKLFNRGRHWMKSINIARATHILLNHICTRGQQVRVYSSLHYLCLQKNYFLYRPYYHPLLDDFNTEDDLISTSSNHSNFYTSLYQSKDNINDNNIENDDIIEDDIYNNDIDTIDNDFDMDINNNLSLKDNTIKNHLNNKRNFQQFRNNSNNKNQKRYTGGYVMKPKIGMYHNIIILDFNSLYPNLQISYGIDPSLMVIDPKYDNLPNIEYLDIYINKQTKFRFVQKQNGIVVENLKNLIANRNIAKSLVSLYSKRIQYESNILKDILFQFKYTNEEECKRCELKNIVSSLLKNNIHFESLHSNMIDYIIIIQKQWNCELELLKESIRDFNFTIYNDDDFIHFIDELKKYKDQSSTKKEFIQTIIQRLEYLEKLYSSYANNKIEVMTIIENIMNDIGMFENDMNNFNSEQNELKACANSNYGFFGSGDIHFDNNTGQLYRDGVMSIKSISASITSKGRESIEKTKKIAEEKIPKSEVIYIDTDSIFWNALLPNTDEALKYSFTLAKELAKEINIHFTGTMNIVHEKTARHIILYMGKCYAMLKYESLQEVQGKIDIKGLQIAKRNTCKYVATLGNTIMNQILHSQDLEEMKKYVQNELTLLTQIDFETIRNRYIEAKKNLENFKNIKIRAIKDKDERAISICDKKISNFETESELLYMNLTELYEPFSIYVKLNDNPSNYKGSTIGHVELAKRLEQRCPGMGPKAGDSIQFLYYYKNGYYDYQDKLKMKDRIEEFDYVLNHSEYKLDIAWYLKNQILKMIQTIFSPILTDSTILLKKIIEDQELKQNGFLNSESFLALINKNK